jgi:hypothetical protein
MTGPQLFCCRVGHRFDLTFFVCALRQPIMQVNGLGILPIGCRATLPTWAFWSGRSPVPP